jgi:hypothetical protein
VPPVQGLFPITSAAPVTQTPARANPVPTVQPAPAPTAPAFITPQPQLSASDIPTPPLASTPEAAPAPPPNTESADAPANTPAATPVAPSVIAVIGSNTISAVPGSPGVVLPNGTPATVGAVTTLIDSNDNPIIVSVASSGIVIQESGSKAFIANPTSPPVIPVGVPAPLATVGGHVIDAEPGATTLVINGQTLTAGGLPITLDGTNNVATLGTNGLIIQFPSGMVSTFAIQTAAPSPTPAGVISDLSGIPISILPGGSGVVVGTQTLSIDGPAITMPGDAVVTLAPPGLIIQKPGEIVSTLSIPGLLAQEMTIAPSAWNGVASAIASSKSFHIL